jgi:hypothetical protein
MVGFSRLIHSTGRKVATSRALQSLHDSHQLSVAGRCHRGDSMPLFVVGEAVREDLNPAHDDRKNAAYQSGEEHHLENVSGKSKDFVCH